MIVGIGIDSIEIDRFAHWHTYAPTTLQRIFSPAEIDYCLSTPNKSAERFAARFATREAFFKALCMINPDMPIPFLTICKNLQIQGSNKSPQQLIVHWEKLGKNNFTKDVISRLAVHLSITHNKSTATSLVIIENVSTKI